MLTDTRIASMRTVLYQIWANLYVEYVVKSPISPVEHTGGVGVANELFEGALESFIVGFLCSSVDGSLGIVLTRGFCRILFFLLLEDEVEDMRKCWRFSRGRDVLGRELSISFASTRLNPSHQWLG
jgi:hypothetical protein